MTYFGDLAPTSGGCLGASCKAVTGTKQVGSKAENAWNSRGSNWSWDREGVSPPWTSAPPWWSCAQMSPRREASSTKGFPAYGFSQPMAQFRSLKWSMTSFTCPSSPSGKWLLDLSFQHQSHKGHSLGITQVCSLHFLCPGQDRGSHFTYTGLSECETGHVKNGIIDLFPPGWNLWLHSL